MQRRSYKILFLCEIVWHNTIDQIEAMLQADPDLSIIVMARMGYDINYWEEVGFTHCDRIKLVSNKMSGRFGLLKGVLRILWITWKEKIDLSHVCMAWSIEAKSYLYAYRITRRPFLIDLLGKERDYKTLSTHDQIVESIQKSAFQLCRDKTLLAIAQEITGNQQKQYLIYNACNIGRAEKYFDVRHIKQEMGIPLERKVILYNHRLIPFKRPHVFVNAMEEIRNRYPNVCFLFLGARGVLREEVQDSIAVKGLSDNTVWIDRFLGGLELDSVYAISDVAVNLAELVVPSQATLEAMSFGVPLVIADELDSDLYVTNGENGFIVFPQPSAVADAVVKILEDEDLQKHMRNAARLRAVRNFNIHDQGKLVTQCYRYILFDEALP